MRAGGCELQGQLVARLVPRFWAAVSAAGDDEPAADLDTVLASSLAVRCSVQVGRVPSAGPADGRRWSGCRC